MKNYKKILVPCDFSASAINAFRFAVKLAKKSKASVHLLNVIVPNISADPTLSAIIEKYPMMEAELKEYVQNKFARLITKYGRQTKITSSAESGYSASAIIRKTATHGFDMIVMGSKGTSGVREVFIGSTTENVLRFSPVPVLIVKDLPSAPVKNIIFPYDPDLSTVKTVANGAKTLQQFFNAKMHIVWINTPRNFKPDRIMKRELDNFARAQKFKKYDVQLISDHAEADGIIEFSKDIPDSIIIMITHGRKGLSHLLHGSITEGVVDHMPQLVYTYSLENLKRKKKSIKS